MRARLLALGLLAAAACSHTKDNVQPEGSDGGGDTGRDTGHDSVHQQLTIQNPEPQTPVDPHALTVPTDPRPVTIIGAPKGGSDQATSVGKLWVRGDEVYQLAGAAVRVDRVVYVHNPCPPGAKCITSGIIHNVHVSVTHNHVTEAAIIPEAKDRVVNGVHVSIYEVREGPMAEALFDLSGVTR